MFLYYLLSVFVLVCLFVYMVFVFMCLCLLFCLSVCLSVCLYICLYVCLSLSVVQPLIFHKSSLQNSNSWSLRPSPSLPSPPPLTLTILPPVLETSPKLHPARPFDPTYCTGKSSGHTLLHCILLEADFSSYWRFCLPKPLSLNTYCTCLLICLPPYLLTYLYTQRLVQYFTL